MEQTIELAGETLTLSDALEAIDVAITLGAEIAAPVNSFLYSVHVEIRDADDGRNNYVDLIGVYQSKESAEADLRGWILNRWAHNENAPWSEDFDESGEELVPGWYEGHEKAFLATHTDIEVIEEYFDDSIDSYGIEKIQVKPFLARD